MAQQVCVVLSAAEREQLATIAAERKQFRAIAARYDKTAHLAAAIIWLN